MADELTQNVNPDTMPPGGSPDPLTSAPTQQSTTQGPAAATHPAAGAPSNSGAAASRGPAADPAFLSQQGQQPGTIRDYLAQQGLGEYAAASDDRAAVERLAQSLRQQQAERSQLAQMAQYGQHYVQHAADFQKYLAERQAAAQRDQASAQRQQLWQPPEYNPRWLEQLERDQQTGEVKVKPGADPTVLSKIRAYTDWKAEQEQKFWSDPYQFVLPGIQPQVEQLVEQRVQAAIAQMQERQAVNAIVQQSQAYLYARDSQGNVLQDSTGRPVFSPQGQEYMNYVAMLAKGGVSDVNLQHQLAMKLAGIGGATGASAPAQAGANGAPAPDANTQAKNAYLAAGAAPTNGAARNPSRGQTINQAVDPLAPPQNPMANFRQQLTDNFKQAGLLPAGI